jgi:hypothetical protein
MKCILCYYFDKKEFKLKARTYFLDIMENFTDKQIKIKEQQWKLNTYLPKMYNNTFIKL